MRWDAVPEGGWLCYQCGMRITSIPEARSHFGEYRDQLPPECIRVAARLMNMGLRKGYSPNVTVNLRDLEGWGEIDDQTRELVQPSGRAQSPVPAKHQSVAATVPDASV